jgi:hypothetical protein
MLSADLTLAKTLMDLRLEEALRGAERGHRWQQPGLNRRGWFSRHACRLLGHLGDALVAAGQRLQQHRTAHPFALGSAQALHPEQ